MLFGILLFAGAVLGLVVGALSSPAIYGLVFGKPGGNADHADEDKF